MAEAWRSSERHGDSFLGLEVILQIWRLRVIFAGLMAPLHLSFMAPLHPLPHGACFHDGFS